MERTQLKRLLLDLGVKVYYNEMDCDNTLSGLNY
jgi:hypothetical protein